MAKKITVYPDPRALAVLGASAPALNQALECWANIVARASADNSKDFAAAEWCLLADVCNGTLWEPVVENPAALLAANVADGHQLEGAGYRWFGGEEGDRDASLARRDAGQPRQTTRAADAAVQALSEKLAALDYAHAWAVLVAVQWFWDHAEHHSDPRQDPWWTLAYRRRAFQKSQEKRKL